MSSTPSTEPVTTDTATIELDAFGDAAVGGAGRVGGFSSSLRGWWKQQTAPRIEDEIVDASGRGSINRIVLPVVAPILIVPAIVLLREPDNMLAAYTMFGGCVALVYSLIGGKLESSSTNPFWVAFANAIVYSAIITLLLWAYSTFEHPRAHMHWVIFLLYSLMIGVNGMSDDPRQPIMSGAFAVAGYVLVVLAVGESLAAGDSVMAQRVGPEFEWVSNSAKIAFLLGSTIVATSSAQRGRELRRSSMHDGLTGLLNRHAMDQCLEHLGQRAASQCQHLTIAMIDIDNFKLLNDEHGHAVGDEVLRRVANTLQRGFRATDLVARYGGEEFIVAFPDTEHEGLGERLEALRRGIASQRVRAAGDTAPLSVTVSIGAARLPADGTSVRDVLALADERLYEAKRAGRNRVVLS